MGQTARGITYPESDGHTRMWEHLQTLAETADAAMPTGRPRAAGTTTVPTGGASSAAVDVAFPAGRFTTAPVVTATPSNSLFGCSTAAITPTGFTLRVRHIDNTASTSSVLCGWTAEEAG